MNKRKKLLTACIILILTTGIDFSVRPSRAETTAGRDDPFAAGAGFSDLTQQSQPVSLNGEHTKPPLFVRTVTLKFLKAANLKSALDKMTTEFGCIGVDDNTNSLIICDTNDNLQRILAEIKQADQTPKQIMIEVVIVDVQLKNDTEIGVDWDFLTTENKDLSYRQSLIFPNRLTYIPPTFGSVGEGASASVIVTNPSTMFQPVGLGSELAIVNDDIRNIVGLLQEKRDVDILASPRVMVVSGQKAEIKTIEEIPYQQITQSTSGGGGASAITSTEFKDVGVTMEVKATVTNESKILLDVKPEQSVSTGMSIGGVPVIDKRGASTTLLMDDGQVAVMGGLRRQETSHIKEQVPLLGDLPLIGFIFSNDKTVVDNSELLVLLSPHIYKDEPVSAEAMARFNQMKNNSLITMPKEPKSKKSSKKQGEK
jgi:type II secretory pathway component GspD/PulD (secretin)